MARRHVGKKDAISIAGERVDKLFALAEEEAIAGNEARAKRYVSLALRISQRHRVPARHKRKYCPECHSYFLPPRNIRVRLSKGMVVMTCLGCGHVLRYPTRRRMREC